MAEDERLEEIIYEYDRSLSLRENMEKKLEFLKKHGTVHCQRSGKVIETLDDCDCIYGLEIWCIGLKRPSLNTTWIDQEGGLHDEYIGL